MKNSGCNPYSKKRRKKKKKRRRKRGVGERGGGEKRIPYYTRIKI